MWGRFLSVLAAYVEMKNAGHPNDVSRFLRLGASIDNARVTVKERLEEAMVKVQALVDEDRLPTHEELAEVDASITARLKEIAQADLTDPPPAG